MPSRIESGPLFMARAHSCEENESSLPRSGPEKAGRSYPKDGHASEICYPMLPQGKSLLFVPSVSTGSCVPGSLSGRRLFLLAWLPFQNRDHDVIGGAVVPVVAANDRSQREGLRERRSGVHPPDIGRRVGARIRRIHHDI